MTVEEIYSKLAQHMTEGIMIHEQLANYYDFLGLHGFKRCHEYHFLKEICEYRSLCRYYINHRNALIPYLPVQDPKIIPDNWQKFTRQAVDTATKKNAVKNGFTLWESWERETKKLYEQMYKELLELGEVACAEEVLQFVHGADKELKKAERETLKLKTSDFDMPTIVCEQNRIHDYYRKKEEKIGVYLC